MMNPLFELQEDIKTEAMRLGFNHVGVGPAIPAPHFQQYLEWVSAGRHADMQYLSRADTLAKREDPGFILEGCQRIICLAMPYQRPKSNLEDGPEGKGRISNYATTVDYHEVIWDKLSQLEAFIHSRAGENVRLKSYTDTGPILERSYASLAGIGIAGKNSCLLIQGTGSYFFLAAVLTDLELPVDSPWTRDLCGSCRRCIEACPTGCILENRTIDAGRCISYLTIENKGEIPDHLKEKVGSWVFGCDVCQIVCPHNAWTPEQTLPLDKPILPEWIDLVTLFSYDEEAFTETFGLTPLSRAKRRGMLRNAAIVLGNQKSQKGLGVLKKALNTEPDPTIQDACRWAIKKIESKA